MEDVENQFGRVKGADWFPLLYRKDVMVLGQGGIGSWASLLLARAGCSLIIFDGDVYEEHNMTGQLSRQSDIGSLKTEAIIRIVAEFSPTTLIEAMGWYKEEDFSNPIVICGFDNMKARKIAFDNWKSLVIKVAEGDRKNFFFQDGRLTAELLQIINIAGDDAIGIERYEKEFLFSDEEVAEADCTFKQTSHCAAMIAAHMVTFLTNWILNSVEETPYRSVPFFHEYIAPLNMTKNEGSVISPGANPA